MEESSRAEIRYVERREDELIDENVREEEKKRVCCGWERDFVLRFIIK